MKFKRERERKVLKKTFLLKVKDSNKKGDRKEEKKLLSFIPTRHASISM
jgi:hypothetical protein